MKEKYNELMEELEKQLNQMLEININHPEAILGEDILWSAHSLRFECQESHLEHLVERVEKNRKILSEDIESLIGSAY